MVLVYAINCCRCKSTENGRLTLLFKETIQSVQNKDVTRCQNPNQRQRKALKTSLLRVKSLHTTSSNFVQKQEGKNKASEERQTRASEFFCFFSRRACLALLACFTPAFTLRKRKTRKCKLNLFFLFFIVRLLQDSPRAKWVRHWIRRCSWQS